MASTSPETDIPVERIITQYPMCRDIIKKLSKKWEKRTKKLNTKWSAEGTFDLAMCREMKALIKNHKPYDKSKKREQKRQKEQEVLDLFRKHGVKEYQEKQMRECAGRTDEKVEHPPPYAPSYDKIKRQMPLVSGTLQVQGELDFDNEQSEEEKEH